MDIPTHLNHKPIVKLENYSKIDGAYRNYTDVQGLSLGVSQWSDEDLSVKVWRHSGKKWSRMSEELPLHRVLDLASLICSALSFAQRDVLLGDNKFSITTSNDSELLNTLKQKLNPEYVEDNLNEPLTRLSRLLKNLGY